MAIPPNFFVTLAIVIIIIALLTSISFFVLWARNQTNVNMLIAWYFLCFTGGIVVDCLRTIYIVGVGASYPDLDMLAYVFKCVSTFVAFILVVGIHIILSDYTEYEQPHRKLLFYYTIVVAAVFGGAGIYWFDLSITGDSGFFIQQFHPVLYFATFFAYLPIALLITFRNLYILQTITNRNIRIKLILFTLLTVFLIVERGYSLGGYSLAESILGVPIDLSLLLDFLALTLICGVFLIIVVKFPDIMESLGSHFSIKKLYVLKSNGLLIFEYDFEQKEFLDGVASEDTLIGGFIYAISEGFKEVLKSDNPIDSFSSGNRSVVIDRGEFVFGVLIVTEDSLLMHQKLSKFIRQYESHYKKDLEAWSGEFSIFDNDLIQNWIFELLREV